MSLNGSETNPHYWDCECDDNFIHSKSDTLVCEKCGTTDEDQPDSVQADIILTGRYGLTTRY
tara:strand:- start:310 stop:495 length:186 start_codon:yes stop_codon:yes gene_type:complete